MAITSFKGSLECVIVLAVAPSGFNCHNILETNMHSCHESGGRQQGRQTPAYHLNFPRGQ